MTLIDVKINQVNPIMAMMGLEKIPDRQITGVYANAPNFHNVLKDNGYKTEGFGKYGVADNYNQVLKKYKEMLMNPDKNYVVSYIWIHKLEEPAQGGWRWHKWGEYIGIHKPEHEHIYDEADPIYSVICYHIFEIIGDE